MLESTIGPDSKLQRFLNFGQATRTRLYLKLGQMNRNGMPLAEAIATIESQQRERGASKATIVAILARWHRGMLDGQQFADIARNDLPAADLVVLRAGERSGQIDRAIDNVLFLQEGIKRIKGAISGGLSYPSVLLAIAVGIMNFVTYVMVPTYSQFAPPDTWTGAAAALATGAWFVAHILPFALIGLAIAIAVSIWSLPRWIGPSRIKAERFIPWSLYKLFYGTGFLIALAGLVKEGVKANDALEIMKENSTPWYKERIDATLRRMEDGEKIATALYRTGMQFPDREIVDDLRAFENFDNFDEMLTQLAHEALETAIDRIKNQMKGFFNIGMMIFAGVLVWYLLGMFGMNSMVSQMASK